ncbi:hypothetical protein ABZ746_06160 [Streptomyces sp. NPDC020096]
MLTNPKPIGPFHVLRMPPTLNGKLPSLDVKSLLREEVHLDVPCSRKATANGHVPLFNYSGAPVQPDGNGTSELVTGAALH